MRMTPDKWARSQNTGSLFEFWPAAIIAVQVLQVLTGIIVRDWALQKLFDFCIVLKNKLFSAKDDF